jgi:cytochrome c-type biogenesis protein CcmH
MIAMVWIAVLAAAIAVFGALVVWGRLAWQPVLLALAIGTGGYAIQGHPALRGVPGVAAPQREINGSELIAARQRETPGGSAGNRWIIIADAMVRHGQFADAVTVLQGAVEENPGDAEVWLAMGYALIGHDRGNPSPASHYAFARASSAASRTGFSAVDIRLQAPAGAAKRWRFMRVRG